MRSWLGGYLPGGAVRGQGERGGPRRPACADPGHAVAGGGAGCAVGAGHRPWLPAGPAGVLGGRLRLARAGTPAERVPSLPGRDRLRRDPVDPAPDGRLRPQRLTSRPGRLDTEKWRGWSDSRGDIDATFSRDFLLTVLTLYWATQTITSTMGLRDSRWLAAGLGPADTVTVPTAVAVFARQFTDDGTLPASGPSACTTSSGGHPCPAAATSRPPSNPACSAATSRPSSTASPARRPARSDTHNRPVPARARPISQPEKQTDIRRSARPRIRGSCCVRYLRGRSRIAGSWRAGRRVSAAGVCRRARHPMGLRVKPLRWSGGDFPGGARRCVRRRGVGLEAAVEDADESVGELA